MKHTIVLWLGLALALALPAGLASAQTPEPTPTPIAVPDALEALEGLPGPLPVPPPSPEVQAVGNELFEYDNITGMVQMAQTAWALVAQNWFVSAVLTILIFFIVLAWMVNLIRTRTTNL